MTDIEIYDRGVGEYLTYISNKVIYAPTSKAQREITSYEKHSDLTPWSFVSFYRDPKFELDSERMNYTTQNLGDLVRFSVEDNIQDIDYVHSIPVNLSYQVDIWSSKNSTVQELSILLLHQLLIKKPVLKVPMNPDGEEARFHMLDITWTDNSDIESERDKGRIYRHTFNFTVDARIKMVRKKLSPVPLCGLPIELYEEGI